MSVVRTITDLAGTVVGRSVHAATHPRETAAQAVGLARGVGGSVLGARRHGGGRDTAGPPAGPGDVHPTDVEPAPERPATPTPEPSSTEPKSPSRNAAHGGPGDDTIDDWREEVEDGPDVTTPAGTTGAGFGNNPDTGRTDLEQAGTEPLMDPSLTKAVKSESDTLRQAAQTPAEHDPDEQTEQRPE